MKNVQFNVKLKTLCVLLIWFVWRRKKQNKPFLSKVFVCFFHHRPSSSQVSVYVKSQLTIHRRVWCPQVQGVFFWVGFIFRRPKESLQFHIRWSFFIWSLTVFKQFDLIHSPINILVCRIFDSCFWLHDNDNDCYQFHILKIITLH